MPGTTTSATTSFYLGVYGAGYGECLFLHRLGHVTIDVDGCSWGCVAEDAGKAHKRKRLVAPICFPCPDEAAEAEQGQYE